MSFDWADDTLRWDSGWRPPKLEQTEKAMSDYKMLQQTAYEPVFVCSEGMKEGKDIGKYCYVGSQ